MLVNLGEAPPKTAGQQWTPEALTSMVALKSMREVWDGEHVNVNVDVDVGSLGDVRPNPRCFEESQCPIYPVGG